jgi:hypothetical protein
VAGQDLYRKRLTSLQVQMAFTGIHVQDAEVTWEAWDLSGREVRCLLFKANLMLRVDEGTVGSR